MYINESKSDKFGVTDLLLLHFFSFSVRSRIYQYITKFMLKYYSGNCT